jgi:two-component system, OmpR family, response regulator RegX3
MHIALLEDEPTLAQEVQALLAGVGHSVVVFPDGNSILHGLLKDTFDLFVLDWHVPGPSGLEVLKLLMHLAY